MSEPIRQPVTIHIDDNGRLVITPRIRDLYRGEEIEWICSEEGWEVTFEEDRTETRAPFISDTFGPGRHSAAELFREEFRIEEMPRYLTGRYKSDLEDGLEYSYRASVSGHGSRSGSVRIFRGIRQR